MSGHQIGKWFGKDPAPTGGSGTAKATRRQAQAHDHALPRQIGDVVRIEPSRLKATIKAWASGATGEHLTSVEVIRNGEVVKTFKIDDRSTEFTTEFELTLAETAWHIARCVGRRDDQIAITNPIYFETSDYNPPRPALARVSGIVTDKATGTSLDGTCEVIQMVGRTPRIQSQHLFKNGRFTVNVPATARLRIQAPGYTPMMKSLFMDTPSLLDLILTMRSEQLIDWRTFEKMRTLLQDVQLAVALTRKG